MVSIGYGDLELNATIEIHYLDIFNHVFFGNSTQ